MVCMENTTTQKTAAKTQAIYAMANSDKADMVMENLAWQMQNMPEKMPTRAAKAMITTPDTPSEKWSISNRMIMAGQGYTDCRTYRQWQAVGRQVMRGEKSSYILAPKIIKYTVKEQHESGKEIEVEHTKLVGFKCVAVFDISQTTGKDITYKPANKPPMHQLANIQYKRGDDSYGSFNPYSGKITLSTESVKTFFHELMHQYDGKSYKLNVDHSSATYAKQEVVAEFGAAVLATLHGMECDKSHLCDTVAYVAGYAKTHTPAQTGMACRAVFERVGKALTLMFADMRALDKAEQQNE